MEPLDDKELKQILARWEAPAAPPGLKNRILRPRKPWWQWPLTGSIRIPVPVGIGVVVLLAIWIYSSVSTRPPAATLEAAKPVLLTDFQPVHQLEPVVIRRQNDNDTNKK